MNAAIPQGSLTAQINAAGKNTSSTYAIEVRTNYKPLDTEQHDKGSQEEDVKVHTCANKCSEGITTPKGTSYKYPSFRLMPRLARIRNFLIAVDLECRHVIENARLHPICANECSDPPGQPPQPAVDRAPRQGVQINAAIPQGSGQTSPDKECKLMQQSPREVW